MIKVIIVDDDETTQHLLKNYVEQTEFLELVTVCSDGIQAANQIRKNDADLVLLDVEMPGMDGMELIDSLSEIPQIILVTSKESYAIKAFEYNVTDYLLKPVQYGRFLKAVERAYENIEVKSKAYPGGGKEKTESSIEEEKVDEKEEDEKAEKAEVSSSGNKNDQAIFIKVKSQLIKIFTDDILWVQAQGDYVSIKTEEKTHTINSTMKHIEKKLPGEKFQRAHRSYIVNTHKIKLVDEGMLVINDRLIPMGNKYQKDLMKKLNMLK